MGSGHFLVNVVEFLGSKLFEAIQHEINLGLIEPDNEGEEYTIDWAKRKVLTSCIYGVDLNSLAVELAKLS